jgi:hypothetical protein
MKKKIMLVYIMTSGQASNSDVHIQLFSSNRTLRAPPPRPYTSLKTQQAITQSGWTVLPHPPHSPDLAPPHFHLSGALKDAIRRNGLEVITELNGCQYDIQSGTRRGQMLVSRCGKAAEVDGDYLEKNEVGNTFICFSHEHVFKELHNKLLAIKIVL